jgi:hypothetical protein
MTAAAATASAAGGGGINVEAMAIRHCLSHVYSKR